jgi:hypothetical protein
VEQEIYPGDSTMFRLMEGLFHYNGLIRYGMVGNAVSQQLDAGPMVDFTVKILKEKPDFLLCPCGCDACERRK